VLIFLLIGTSLTIIIQSSRAVMALTLVMCFNGWIGFEMAAAMVLGENIGTTITANLAALIANTTAKRTARSHLLFNVIGVFLVLSLFHPFLRLIGWFLNTIGQVSPFDLADHTNEDAQAALPIALSAIHTVFNVMNTLLQVWFIPYLAKIVVWMVPAKEDEDEEFKLKYINSGLVAVNEASTLQAKKEIESFIQRTWKMYNLTKELYEEEKPSKVEKLIEKIRKYEQIADEIDVEIANFLTKVASSELSKTSADTINLMLRLVSRIESIDDSCSIMAELIFKKKVKKMAFTPEMEMKIQHLFTMIDDLFSTMNAVITVKNYPIDVPTLRAKRDAIELNNEKLNLQNLKDIKKGLYKYKVGIIYTDLFSEMAVMSDHIYHSLKYMKDIKV
jgi:phosphate:Na+ symporter